MFNRIFSGAVVSISQECWTTFIFFSLHFTDTSKDQREQLLQYVLMTVVYRNVYSLSYTRTPSDSRTYTHHFVEDDLLKPFDREIHCFVINKPHCKLFMEFKVENRYLMKMSIRTIWCTRGVLECRPGYLRRIRRSWCQSWLAKCSCHCWETVALLLLFTLHTSLLTRTSYTCDRHDARLCSQGTSSYRPCFLICRATSWW